MQKCFLFILFVFLSCCTMAQAGAARQNRLGLLKELRLTNAQKLQLQQLIREERWQQYLRQRKLQQILTPEQIKRLKKYKDTNVAEPDSTKHK